MQIVTWLGVAILGWLMGVVVNYLSDVLPWRRKFARPFCLKCNQDQVISNYILWPRECPNCQTRRSLRSWTVEALFILIGLWLWDHHPEKLGFWLSFLLLGYFGVVVVIDLEHRLILHPVSLFGAVLALGIGVYLHGFVSSISGGALGFGIMLLLYWFGDLLLRLTARLRGETVDDVALGFGDVNLSGIIGLLLGFPAIVLGLFLAIILGGIVSLIYLISMLIIRRYRLYMALPYGPFLVSGAILLLFFRNFLSSFFK